MLDDLENSTMEAGCLLGEGLQPPPAPLPLAPRDIWKPRDLLLFVAFIPFALLASKVALLIGYSVLRPFTGWHAKVELAQSDTIFLLVQQCVFYVLILAFFFLLARLQHQQPLWKSLGWRKPTAKEVLGYLAGGCGLARVVDGRHYPTDVYAGALLGIAVAHVFLRLEKRKCAPSPTAS